jgi:YhcH/YjgK/YiaL family protein
MIIDQITNSHLYYSLHPGLKVAFETIQQTDLTTLPIGRIELDGENLFAMVQQSDSKPIEQGIWEAHRRYMDLQMEIQGSEKIGYANIARLSQGEYNAAKDFIPLFGAGDFLTMVPGNFILLLPQDAHMPGIAVNAPAPVKKLVIKIAVR